MFKRSFALILSMIMVIGLLAGCSPAETPKKEVVEKSYDVVVVGAGAAGLAAAIEAAEKGATVAVLEKMPMVGGSTVLSGGIVYATGSTIQKNFGVEDSVADLVAYWSERAEGNVDTTQLEFVAERSGATIDWLVDLGVEFGDPTPTGTSPVLRAHTSPNHGDGIIKPLKTYADSKNVEFFLQTSATELMIDANGDVIGVKALDKDKNEMAFSAKSVIMATGGFDRSTELVKTYAPIAEGQTSFAGTGNTGDGMTMAVSAGAEVVSKGGVIGFRTVENEPAYTTEVCMLMWMPYLSVNTLGERFVNEAIDYPLFYESLVKQPEGISYLIFDGSTYQPALDKAVEKGSAFVADSLEDLAKQAGIDADAFVNTVAEYNTMIESGVDTEFGKSVVGHSKVETGKFYALKVLPATLGTMSGVKTDLDTQVLTKEGTAIKGLFAAGEVANGDFFYQVYPASGSSIQMSLTFGRVAGTKAAEYAGK